MPGAISCELSTDFFPGSEINFPIIYMGQPFLGSTGDDTRWGWRQERTAHGQACALTSAAEMPVKPHPDALPKPEETE